MEIFKSYAVINFTTVERLMKDSQYPGLEKFKNIHKTLLANIEMNDRKYRQRVDTRGMLQYLKEYWLERGRVYESEYIVHLRGYYAAEQ